MNAHVVKVPDIGEGIAEVELVEWHVQPGDTVAADQVLADVMTDKATVEVPSPVAGVIAAITGGPGDKLAVGSELLRIEVAGPAHATSAAPPAPAHAEKLPLPAGGERAGVRGTPVPQPPQPSPQPAPAPREREVEGSAATAGTGTKPLASPSVRRHARELDVDLARVPGTGPGGRVMHEDVVRFAARAAAPAARYAARDGETVVPVIGMRRQIAQHMQAALRIPHFTYVEEVDVTELEALRAKLNERYAAARGKLTLLPFVLRAIALAAPDFPQMNARYDDAQGVVTRYAAVNAGIATQTPAGLMVPVVRHAEARDLWGNAAEIARLAEAARNGRVAREDLAGSTITITSLGPLGGIVTTPVINAPEVAIVGVNRIVERPMFAGTGVVARRLMNLSSSFDHRVIDGQDAALFVQAIRAALECPALLFVE
ncbi:MAG: dihydrolipoamide acetyltransferase family protein [Burkholderiales bacterium]